MGKGARSGRRSRASGAGGGGRGSKRPRRVAEEEQEEVEQEEEEVEPVEEEKEAVDGEDYCFVCKDGGELRVCDFRGCHKAYHAACVGKDSDFLNSDEEFICEWHTCFICKGRSRYYCFCCPWNSFCQGCVKQAEFVPVLRKTKGFCTNCLRMVIMIEKNVDVDSDGERADFDDKATYEFLFKDYWEEIVKDKEGMTLDKLEKAYASLKKGLNCKQDLDLEKVHDEERSSDDDFVGNSDDDDNKPSSITKFYGTSNTMKSFLREDKSMKNRYVGWGSKELIEFLSSIGKDTLKSLDQHGAAEVVRVYIQQNGLLGRDKKRIVTCDDKLKILFRRSKVRYNRIFNLLGKHIAADMTSEDDFFANSDDNNETLVRKKARIGNYNSSTPEINKKCFGALVRHNINLIYLKKSLVVDLLKDPDTFDSKVSGCFVRVKIDPYDHSFCMHKTLRQHKKLHQLGLVTGTRKSSEEYKINNVSTDVLLCICSCSISDVKISSLSDDEFDEEECQDLQLLAKNESFKRPTVGDLEEKARSLRKDIMSHWISKELQRLERLIDRASEKGWHNEKFEYLDKKQLLRKPAEQQRLLEEVPQVIPEMEDSKDTEFQTTEQDKLIEKSTVALQGTNGTGAPFLRSCTEKKVQVTKACTDGGSTGIHTPNQSTKAAIAFSPVLPKYLHHQAATEANSAGDISPVQKLDDKGAKASVDGDKTGRDVQLTGAKASVDGDKTGRDVQLTGAKASTDGDKTGPDVQLAGAKATDGDKTGTDVQHGSIEATKANTAGDAPGAFFEKQCAKAANVITIEDDDDGNHPCDKGEQTTVFIDLDADDARDNHSVQHETNSRGHRRVRAMEEIPQYIWYYIDPYGEEQGPFTIEQLRRWWKTGIFPKDFKVWRTGQTSNDAILLTDALQMTL